MDINVDDRINVWGKNPLFKAGPTRQFLKHWQNIFKSQFPLSPWSQATPPNKK